MLKRKYIEFKKFDELDNEFKINSKVSSVQDCSFCSMTLRLYEDESRRIVVYPHLYDAFEPETFPFTEEGYQQAINFYLERLDEYLSKIEEEYYIEENYFSRLINTSIF